MDVTATVLQLKTKSKQADKTHMVPEICRFYSF